MVDKIKIQQKIEDILYRHLYLPITEGLARKITQEIMENINDNKGMVNESEIT